MVDAKSQQTQADLELLRKLRDAAQPFAAMRAAKKEYEQLGEAIEKLREKLAPLENDLKKLRLARTEVGKKIADMREELGSESELKERIWSAAFGNGVGAQAAPVPGSSPSSPQGVKVAA